MFSKHFTAIFDSSLADDWQVRMVFEDFLKLADKHGIVDMTPESIARRTNVPLEIVLKGIAALEAPDPVSRTPDNEGRRIIRLDDHRAWGWRITNFAKYRASATREMLRMTNAQRQAAWRRRNGVPPRKGDEPAGNPPSDSPKSNTEAEAEAEQSRCSNGDVTARNASRYAESRVIPAWEEVELHANRIGLAHWKAKDWFDEMESIGWKDWQGRDIQRWQSAMARVKTKWEADGRPQGPTPRAGGTAKAATIWELKSVLEEKQKAATAFLERHSHESPTGIEWRDQAKRREYSQMLREIAEVKARIQSFKLT